MSTETPPGGAGADHTRPVDRGVAEVAGSGVLILAIAGLLSGE